MVERAAIISECGRYRYLLERRWDPAPGDEAGPAVWVMCNPSTADADQDDPTIRKCMGFTKLLNRHRMIVVNLFGWRATKPKALLEVEDPVGPQNQGWVEIAAMHENSIIIAAWGEAVNKKLRYHIPAMMRSLQMSGRPVFCYGKTAEGMPRHPVMLAYATPLEEYGYGS